MTKDYEEKKEWCDNVAELIVDEMIHAELVKKENFEEAVAVAAEEIFARLIVNDYPPPFNPKLITKKS